MIDNSGFTAYESYKKGVNFLFLDGNDSASYSWWFAPPGNFYKSWYTEILSRKNINMVWHPRNKSNAVAVNDVMFADLNMVGFCAGEEAYGINNKLPFIYRQFNFLPGSAAMIFRSFPANGLDRPYGGLCRFTGSQFTEFIAADGSDLPFKHMTTLACDTINHWVWCGTGISQRDIGAPYGDGTDEAGRRLTESSIGGGIAVYDMTSGALVNRFTSKNSPLINDRVTKLAFDPYHRRVWAATYSGVQYYDCQTKAWQPAIDSLSSASAAAYDIFVDPFDTDKVYCSYFYDKADVSSKMAGGATSLFEYSKGSGAVVKYPLYGSKSYFPRVVKTSATDLWALNGKQLKKYDLKTKQTLRNIALIDSTYKSIHYPGALCAQTNSSGETYLYAGVMSLDTAKKTCCLLRVRDAGPDSLQIKVIRDTLFAGVENEIRTIITNPANPNELFIAIGKSRSTYGDGKILRSIDGRGEIWSVWRGTGYKNLNEIARDPGSGAIYAVRGYQTSEQQRISDFLYFGACATGGGISHSNMVYNPSYRIAAKWTDAAKLASGNEKWTLITNYAASPYTADCSYTTGHVAALSFRYLDGFYLGESRFSAFYQYPATGGSGYSGHLLPFDPKCAPFAPRVNEAATVFNVENQTTLRIRLFSPGLQPAADGFLSSTISNQTVSLTNSANAPVAIASVTYDSSTKTIVLTASSSLIKGEDYQLTLKCGLNGIKNIKGASLINTRANEFKDEISYLYHVPSSTEIEGASNAKLQAVSVWPNPFNPNSQIRYSLQNAGDIRLTLFDTQGREVRRFMHGFQVSGDHVLVWNGKDIANRPLSGGLYFLQLETRIKTSTHKVILLR
jgi:hypothetical protein